MPLEVLLGKPPRMTRDVARRQTHRCHPLILTEGRANAAYRVLSLPAVADKTFLITIGDRTVGGMTARDQMVGPWQVPVADVAVHHGLRPGRRSDGHGRAHAGGG